MNKKYWKKFLAASILVGGLNFSPTLVNFDTENLQIFSIAYAEIKDVTAKDAAILDFADESAEYTAKVQNVAKMRAIQRARERAGVYLKSFSRTVNGVLTADDISAYTSDKIEVSDVKFQKLFYQVKDVNGNLTGKIGFMYEATVTAKIDTTGLQEYIQKSLQEKQRLIDRDKNLQKNIEEVDKKYEDLRQNAKNKTPEQIKSELEQINKKIEETEKTPVVQNESMIFSQPVTIGYIGYTPQPNYRGLPIADATYNDGTPQNEKISPMFFRDLNVEPNSINVKTYLKGVAAWDELYCAYDIEKDYYNLKFGGKNNYILNTDSSSKKISKIDNNKDMKFYILYHNYCVSHLHILGKQKNGKWVVYLDSKKISERYFSGKDGYKLDGGIIYEEPICKDDTIIVKYYRWSWSWKGRNEYEGEFRFKWDDKAQWFGVEQVVY